MSNDIIGEDLKIEYLGHAFFKVSSKNVSVVFDPVDEESGYVLDKKVDTNLLVISHMHHDHCNRDAVNVIPSSDISMKNVKTISSFHDDAKGNKRGTNDIHVVNINGYKVCHLGDLGHLLDEKTVSEIGDVDVLFIPVGGIYTIDASMAKEIAESVSAKIIVPMHYATSMLNFKLDSPISFIDKVKDKYEVIEIKDSKVILTKEELDKENKKICFMNFLD